MVDAMTTNKRYLASTCTAIAVGFVVSFPAACAPTATDAVVRSASVTPGTPTTDPRVGLGAGWMDAEEASWNMNLLANRPRPEGFYRPDDIGDMSFANSDMAFQGEYVIVGNYHGFKVYDVSDPGEPDAPHRGGLPRRAG
jgi:hypothetical protein